jgi:hypothetical protein
MPLSSFSSSLQVVYTPLGFGVPAVANKWITPRRWLSPAIPTTKIRAEACYVFDTIHRCKFSALTVSQEIFRANLRVRSNKSRVV